MTQFTSYTVFDSNPMQSGDTAWPDATDITFDGDVDAVCDHIVEAALACGEYEEGDSLWITFYSDDDSVTRRVAIAPVDRDNLIAKVLAADLVAPEQVCDAVLDAYDACGIDAAMQALAECVANDAAEARSLGVS